MLSPSELLEYINADTAGEIDRDVDNAIEKLYTRSPAAKELSK